MSSKREDADSLILMATIIVLGFFFYYFGGDIEVRRPLIFDKRFTFILISVFMEIFAVLQAPAISRHEAQQRTNQAR